MNCNEIPDRIHDYVDGDLPESERIAFETHLQDCETCREKTTRLHHLQKQTRELPLEIQPPGNLWKEIRLRIDTPATGYSSEDRGASHDGIHSPWWWAAAAAVLLVLARVWWMQPEVTGWQIARINGAPTIETRSVDSSAILRAGEWLETDTQSRARVIVGMIGEVEVEPNSRLRILETKAHDHRIEFNRGTMHATIWAPPRIFFVETPSATAVDLGCEYSLTVAEDGTGLLHVTFGYVMLERGDRSSIIPAGAMCLMRPKQGPGTPFAEDAPGEFRTALEQFDFGQNAESVYAILALSRKADAVTLYHLLPRTSGRLRAEVTDRLAALTRFPPGVTREGILQENSEMLRLWGDDLDLNAGGAH